MRVKIHKNIPTKSLDLKVTLEGGTATGLLGTFVFFNQIDLLFEAKTIIFLARTKNILEPGIFFLYQTKSFSHKKTNILVISRNSFDSI